MQGLLKDEGKAKFGDAFRTWQKQADTFAIDGHAPVRELWYRASLAWQEILNPEQVRLCVCDLRPCCCQKQRVFWAHRYACALVECIPDSVCLQTAWLLRHTKGVTKQPHTNITPVFRMTSRRLAAAAAVAAEVTRTAGAVLWWWLTTQ